MSFELLDARSRFVERTWKRLEAESRPSYFLTWGWVETWLERLPVEMRPQLAIVTEHGMPVSAFFVGASRRMLSTRHHVNTVGDARFDELCVEHNGAIGRPLDLTELPSAWRELELPAMRADAIGRIDPDRFNVRIDRRVRTSHVRLDRVRAHGDYIGLLGSSTRAQIRRARRRAGELTLEVASTIDEARGMLDELIERHGIYWRTRGCAGAFADPWFTTFHRALLEKRFAHGEIQLVRLRANGKSLGCLYNLVAYGHVSFYQCGIEHSELKPGYLIHAATIEHCAARGLTTYDFLAGDARYKQNLGTDRSEMLWARVQRKLVRFAIEDRVRSWARDWKALLAPTVPAAALLLPQFTESASL